MEDINSTDKRFPRTLAEAFPHHYREQYIPIVIHRPKQINPDWLVMGACIFALGFLLGLAVGAPK